LEQDPKNEIATESLASLNYTEAGGIPDLDAKIKKLDEAEQWYTKLTELNPKKKEAFYSLGVIAWAKWYPALQAARNGLKMKQEDPGPLKDKKVRDDLRAKYGAMIDDGLKNLQTAIDLDGNYDDAMAYVNLLYRERADLADSKLAYDQDIQSADNWLQKALDTRKVKAGALPATPGEAAK
jgi:tetratricopeptide (TPR) repeat protein